MEFARSNIAKLNNLLRLRLQRQAIVDFICCQCADTNPHVFYIGMNERFVSHIEGQPAIYDPASIDNSSSSKQELAIATQGKQGETA